MKKPEHDNLVVELETGVYLADWDGDPGRTLKIDSAKRFKKEKTAKQAIKAARKYKPFPNAKVFEC